MLVSVRMIPGKKTLRVSGVLTLNICCITSRNRQPDRRNMYSALSLILPGVFDLLREETVHHKNIKEKWKPPISSTSPTRQRSKRW